MCIVSKLLLYEAPMRMEPIGCRGQRIIHDDALTDRQHALKCVAEWWNKAKCERKWLKNSTKLVWLGQFRLQND